MTNQEQMNEIMGKLLDLPQPPVFHEDDYPYPWKPFKSNGGTGDPSPDLLNPSTTAIPQSKSVTPKLCPFRKKTIFYQNDYTTRVEGEKVMLNLPRAEWMEEEFLPCIREKCAVWNEKGQVCCYGL